MKSWLRLLILAIAALALSSASHAQCTSINPLGALPSDTSNQHQWCTAGANVYQGQVVSLNGSGNIVPIPHGSTGGAYGVAQQNAQSGQTGVKVLISGRTSLSTDNACAVGNQIGISTTSDGNGTCATSAASQVLGVAIVASSGASATSVQISPLSSAGSSSGGGGLVAPVYNVKNYGAIGDFAHIAQDTAGIQAAFTAALATGGTVFFPHGSYQFDNSAGLYLVNNAAGLTVAGEDKASVVYFNTLANYGWSFTNANGLTIKGMYFQYQPTRTTRGGGGPLSIDSSTNVLVENNYFNNTNLSGLRLGNNNNVRVIGNTIANSLANGIFSVNNINMHFENTNCVNNGDACEEYSFFDAGTTQPFCDNITSTGMTSNNDNTGFVVNGCTNVAISNFHISGVGGAGINILQDNTTTTTHFPDQVEVGNGTIVNTGFGTNASNTTAAVAMEINIAQTPSTLQRINLHDIVVVHTAQRCLFLGDHNTVELTTNNIWCDDNGSTQVTGSGEAIVLAGGNNVKMSNTYVANANRYALRDTLATYFESHNFTSKNNQVGNSSVAAINNSSTGTFIMDGVNMIDTYATTNRSAIQQVAASGNQTIRNITTSCTVNPCGVVTSSDTLTPAASQGLDLSAALNADAFRVTNLAAAATTKNGSYAYDTTNKNVHVGANGVDNFAAIIPSATPPTNGDCASWSVSGGVVRIADAGPCGTSGGAGCTSGCNYVLTQGDAPQVAITASTVMTANNVPQIVQFYNPLSRKLGNVVVRIVNAAASGHFSATVYSVSGTTGTAIWTTGSLSTASAVNLSVTPTPVTLTGGVTYLIAWCADNTTATIASINNGAGTLGLTSGGPAHTYGTDATDTCTAGVLPSTITTTNITNSASASIPAIYATN